MLEINIVYFCTFVLLARQYVNAMAGFQRKYGNEWAILQENVSGILLPEGNFVFFLDNGRERQLVLTTNAGHFLKSGYLIGKLDSWMEPDSWKKSTSYNIVDFQGIKGLCIFIFHFNVSNMARVKILFFLSFARKLFDTCQQTPVLFVLLQ